MSRWTRRELLWAASAMGLSHHVGAAPFEVLSDAPLQLQTPLEALDGLITPTEHFFVRSHFGPPRFDLLRKLTVDGLVDHSLRLSLTELRKFPATKVTAVLQCAGNGRRRFSPPIPGVQWTHGAMGQAEWVGVRLSALLEKAKWKAHAKHVHLFGADGPPKPQTPPFIRSLPLEKALHPDTLVAWQMNGAPLTLEHGAPLRLVVPGWAGDHWLKWLVGVAVAEEEHSGFFVQKAYRIPSKPVAPGTKVPPEQMEPVTVMPVKSVVTFPKEGAVLPIGKMEVRGVAFSGAAGVQQVEVSLDEGKTWQPTRLEGESGAGRWQRFIFEFEATPGSKSVLARATDTTGATQPKDAVWNPSGYFWNAWHRVSWSVV